MKLNNQSKILLSSHRYEKNNVEMLTSIKRLASGVKLHQAADNASGLAISEKLRAQLRGTSQAERNMQDGLSVLQAANEGLNNVNALLQRAREISVMAANDTLIAEDRNASQMEMDQLMEGINDTAEKLQFNTKKILGENAPLTLMVGANPQQQIKIDLIDISTTALGLTSTSIASHQDSSKLIAELDHAITFVTNHTEKIGSYYEAIEHHMTNAMNYETNITSSFSKIHDTDMAKETLNFLSVGIRQNGDKLLVKQVNQDLKDVLKLFS